MNSFKSAPLLFVVVISIGLQVCSFGHFPKGNVGCVICLIY